MGRIIRGQLAEAVVGLAITSLLSYRGEIATFLGLTGTGVVMALTVLLAKTDMKFVLPVLALLFPFASTTALEAYLGKPLTAITKGQGPADDTTTVQSLYDKYNKGGHSTSKPLSTGSLKPAKNGRRADVSPTSLNLTCAGPTCRQPVTVTSGGTSPVMTLKSTVFPDSALTAWHQSHECDYKTLSPGDTCQFWVWADESGSVPTAQLVVHDNSPRPASRVSLTVTTETGGGSSPCKPGFVPREAVADDPECVTPHPTSPTTPTPPTDTPVPAPTTPTPAPSAS